jgi:ribosomal protein S18 acetylase RimI-like enzyme
MTERFTIRRAAVRDAEAILSVLETVAAERIYSAVDEPWALDQERTYLRSLSPREATHVAVVESGEVIGFQNLDLWAAPVQSMRHVGQIGTFLLPAWRRQGLGHALFSATQAFARTAGYRKFVIQVRASNSSALAFYNSLGFRECGRFTRQVRIDDQDDDEILMECFL